MKIFALLYSFFMLLMCSWISVSFVREGRPKLGTIGAFMLTFLALLSIVGWSR